MNIDRINTQASKMTIFGWLAGLAYYNWFASNAAELPWWMHATLVIGGMFVVSIVIGGGMALAVSLVTKAATGHHDGSPHGFAWAAFISPVLAFFAAKYALQLAASVS